SRPVACLRASKPMPATRGSSLTPCTSGSTRTPGCIGMAKGSDYGFGVLAFAGAVTMIPGLSLYRALRGALQLARFPGMADLATAAGTLAHGLQECLVVSGLALGLILGARAVLALAQLGRARSPRRSPVDGSRFGKLLRAPVSREQPVGGIHPCC